MKLLSSSRISFYKNPKVSKTPKELFLNGESLELLSIKMNTTAKVIRHGKNFSIEEASVDDPIYTQGFIVGARNLKHSSQINQEKTSRINANYEIKDDGLLLIEPPR